MRSRVGTAALAAAYARAVERPLDEGHRAHPGRVWRMTRERVVGRGRPCFERAARALLTWDVHRTAGVAVHPPDTAVVDGGTVVLGWGLGRAAVVAPCRVVGRRDTGDAAGFTYATVRGHPVSGREEFTVVFDGCDVTFRIVAESVPAWPLLGTVAPLTRLVQDRITAAYLSAMVTIAA